MVKNFRELNYVGIIEELNHGNYKSIQNMACGKTLPVKHIQDNVRKLRNSYVVHFFYGTELIHRTSAAENDVLSFS